MVHMHRSDLSRRIRRGNSHKLFTLLCCVQNLWRFCQLLVTFCQYIGLFWALLCKQLWPASSAGGVEAPLLRTNGGAAHFCPEHPLTSSLGGTGDPRFGLRKQMWGLEVRILESGQICADKSWERHTSMELELLIDRLSGIIIQRPTNHEKENLIFHLLSF